MFENLGIKLSKNLRGGQQIANARDSFGLTGKACERGDDRVPGCDHAVQDVQQSLVISGFEDVVCGQQRRSVFLRSLFQAALKICLEIDGSGFERDRFGHGRLLTAQKLNSSGGDLYKFVARGRAGQMVIRAGPLALNLKSGLRCKYTIAEVSAWQ